MAKRKRISHGKVAADEAQKAALDAASAVIPEFGKARSIRSAIGHADKAVQHAKKAAEQIVKDRKRKVKKALTDKVPRIRPKMPRLTPKWPRLR